MNQNPYESPTASSPIEGKPLGKNSTNGPELFGVAVRGIGLYFILIGVGNLVFALLAAAGVGPTKQFFEPVVQIRIMLESWVPGGIAFFFADPLVRLAYRNRPNLDTESPANREDN
jgi:hypothetical protein